MLKKETKQLEAIRSHKLEKKMEIINLSRIIKKVKEIR